MARSMVWLRVGLLLDLGVTALVGGWAALPVRRGRPPYRP